MGGTVSLEAFVRPTRAGLLLIVVALLVLTGIVVLPSAIAETDGPLTVIAEPPDGTTVTDGQVIVYDIAVVVGDGHDVLTAEVGSLESVTIQAATVDGSAIEPGDAAHPGVDADGRVRADLTSLADGTLFATSITAVVDSGRTSAVTFLEVDVGETLVTGGRRVQAVVHSEHPYNVYTEGGILRPGAGMTADPPGGTEVVPGEVINYTVSIAPGSSDEHLDFFTLQPSGGQIVADDVVGGDSLAVPAFTVEATSEEVLVSWLSANHVDDVLSVVVPVRVGDGATTVSLRATDPFTFPFYLPPEVTHPVAAREPSPSNDPTPSPSASSGPSVAPVEPTPPATPTQSGGPSLPDATTESTDATITVERRTVPVTG